MINDTIDNVKSSVKVSVKTSYSSNPYYKTVHTRPAPDQPQMPELYNKRPGGQACAIISMALGYSIGIFTLAGLITFTALSAAVSHMFIVPVIIFGVVDHVSDGSAQICKISGGDGRVNGIFYLITNVVPV